MTRQGFDLQLSLGHVAGCLLQVFRSALGPVLQGQSFDDAFVSLALQAMSEKSESFLTRVFAQLLWQVIQLIEDKLCKKVPSFGIDGVRRCLRPRGATSAWVASRAQKCGTQRIGA